MEFAYLEKSSFGRRLRLFQSMSCLLASNLINIAWGKCLYSYSFENSLAINGISQAHEFIAVN